MRRIKVSVILALIFCVVLNLASFEGECEGVRGKVLRLHVVANSNSLSDQQLKLKVRDRIVMQSESLFSDCDRLDQAIEKAEQHLPDIVAAAREELAANNSDYDVRVTLREDYFPTKQYQSVTLPAGIYEAIRVEIGRAEGCNWWCVMFPMMCIPGASEQQEMESVLTREQLNIVECDGYEVKFKCVELIQELLKGRQ